MLLSWRKKISVALFSNSIGIAVAGRGWSRRPTETYVLDVPEGADSSFNRAVSVLEKWLSEKNYIRASLHVTISDEFVHYGLVPGSSVRLNPAAKKILAQACLESIHGACIKSCEIKYEEDDPRVSAVACAIEREYIIAIRSLGKGQKIKLHSLVSAYVRTVDAYRRILPESSLMIMPGKEMLVGAVRDSKGWSSVWQQPLSVPLNSEAILAVIKRETLLRSLPIDVPVICFNSSVDDQSMFEPLKSLMIFPGESTAINRYPVGLATLVFGR